MAQSFTYPGVYVSEKESGARAVPAAATSIAMFIGMTDIGPFGRPTRVQNLSDYHRQFGETSGGEMAMQVGQFFINGGGDAFVMRIADDPVASVVVLQNQAGTDVLELTAVDPGVLGDQIRAEVSYATSSPERTFNLTVFRSVPDGRGGFSRAGSVTYPNLSMDPNDARYVERIVNATPGLVSVDAANFAGSPAAADLGGTSVSGLFWDTDADTARDDIGALLDATHRAFRVSLAGRPVVTAVIAMNIDAGGNVLNPVDHNDLEARLVAAIVQAYLAIGINVAAEVSAHVLLSDGVAGSPRLLELRCSTGAILISSAATNDCAALLQLGTANGGIEIDAFSNLRPAPNGLSSQLIAAAGPGTRPTARWLGAFYAFGAQLRSALGDFVLTDPANPGPPAQAAVAITGVPGDPIRQAAAPIVAGASGSFRLIGDALGELASGINALVSARWTASRVGAGLHFVRNSAFPDGAGLGLRLTTNGAYDIGAATRIMAAAGNISAYTVGSTIIGGLQSNATPGDNGNLPTLGDYQAAFATIESEVEIFNMMVLPRAPGQADVARTAVFGAASAFCARSRAILFVDPLATWTDIAAAEAGADAIKIGVDTRHAVAYWPRLLVPTSATPSGVAIDPSGSMAGLYARTDTNFGTWRAPAGIQATLTGVSGLERLMSDAENGRINPKALNAIRLFPSGVTAWGARMMVGADDTGNVDDKYVNVRRMMLFIENSLYRGLRFAVFRGNAEPLWASIRLAAGSFMNGLMQQGAFASNTKRDAYFVLCDATTTTAADINLGIVNVIVGFAPLKPAEFVHLTVTQIAGQSEV